MSDGIVEAEIADGEPPRLTRAGGVRQRLRGRGGFWLGLTAGTLGIVLLVVGLLAFGRASDRRAAASEAESRRGSLQVAERKANNTGSTINRASAALVDNVAKVTTSSDEVTAARNAITDAFNQAVALGTGGDLNGAQAAFGAQSQALAGLDVKVAAAQQALVRAQQSLDQLRTTEHG